MRASIKSSVSKMNEKNLNYSTYQKQFNIKETKASYVQYLAALVTLLGALCVGSGLSFTSPALSSMQHEVVYTVHLPILNSTFKANETTVEPFLEDPKQFRIENKMFLEKSQKEIASWIISIVCIGSFVGSFTAGSICDWMGFRRFLFLTSLICICGWLQIKFSVNLIMVLIGRFTTGFASGFYSVSVNVYINEISTLKCRGFLGSSFQGFITFGIIFTTFFGMFFDFRSLSLLCAVPAALLAMLIFFFPESPHWLIKQHREVDALKALKRLRSNSTDCEAELSQIIEQIKNARLEVDDDSIDEKSIVKAEAKLRSGGCTELIIDVNKIIENDKNKNISYKNEKAAESATIVHSSSSSFLTDLKLPHVYKPLLIGLIIVFYQDMIGTNGLFGTLETVLASANLEYINEQQAALVVNICFSIFAWSSCIIVNFFGRRTLLLFNSVGYVISYVLISLHYLAKEHHYDELAKQLNYLPIIGLILFFFVHAIGYGAVAWFMVPELCVIYKSQISSICTCSNWLLSFVIMKNFTILVDKIDYAYTFLFFAFVGFLSLVCSYFFVPETKDKSAKEIKRLFYRKNSIRPAN